MGLDCLWCPPPNKEPINLPLFDPPLQLTIGMVTGDDGRAFRGKVYADFFMDLFGVDLYRPMSNEEVLHMADRLELFLTRIPPDRPVIHLSEQGHETTIHDVTDLARAFRQFGILGCTLEPWY
jgi:hypothetical protein